MTTPAIPANIAALFSDVDFTNFSVIEKIIPETTQERLIRVINTHIEALDNNVPKRNLKCLTVIDNKNTDNVIVQLNGGKFGRLPIYHPSTGWLGLDNKTTPRIRINIDNERDFFVATVNAIKNGFYDDAIAFAKSKLTENQ